MTRETAYKITAFVRNGEYTDVSRKRGGPHERRRAVPRRELLPLWGQRSGVSRKRGGPHERRRAVPRRELLPLWGQRAERSGVSRKRGGPNIRQSAAAPEPNAGD